MSNEENNGEQQTGNGQTNPVNETEQNSSPKTGAVNGAEQNTTIVTETVKQNKTTVTVGIRIKSESEERFRAILGKHGTQAEAVEVLMNAYDAQQQVKHPVKTETLELLTERTVELISDFELKPGTDEYKTAVNTGLALYCREKDGQRFRLFMVKQSEKQG